MGESTVRLAGVSQSAGIANSPGRSFDPIGQLPGLVCFPVMYVQHRSSYVDFLAALAGIGLLVIVEHSDDFKFEAADTLFKEE